MLIQSGTKVAIQGLTSEAGKKLNNRTGTAQHFFPETLRWSVLLDSTEEVANDATPDRRVVSLSITKLTLVEDAEIMFALITPDNPGWAVLSEGGKRLLCAGTKGVDGPLSLGIMADIHNPNLTKEGLLREASLMGVPKEFIFSFLDELRC